jgi:hypothetical protein
VLFLNSEVGAILDVILRCAFTRTAADEGTVSNLWPMATGKDTQYYVEIGNVIAFETTACMTITNNIGIITIPAQQP